MYICHFCGNKLKLGTSYTWECNCGSCYLSVDKYGNPTKFKFDYFDVKSNLYKIIRKQNNSFLFNTFSNGGTNTILVSADKQISIKNNVIEVEKLFNALSNLIGLK